MDLGPLQFSGQSYHLFRSKDQKHYKISATTEDAPLVQLEVQRHDPAGGDHQAAGTG